MASALGRRVRRTVWNGLRLRCPRCGGERLFQGWFRMREDCGVCDLHYEREAGYFVGAIYINYAVTVVLSIAGYFLLDATTDLTLQQEILVWGAFSVTFPLWFFRYSRSLWLALDHVFSPEPMTLRVVHGAGARRAS
jgi:uncharacterized protein (DUF983 family)